MLYLYTKHGIQLTSWTKSEKEEKKVINLNNPNQPKKKKKKLYINYFTPTQHNTPSRKEKEQNQKKKESPKINHKFSVL